MIRIRQLRERILKNPSVREEICKETGMNRSSLKRKLYNPEKFTIFDIVVIKRILNLTMDETIKKFAPFVANYNKD